MKKIFKEDFILKTVSDFYKVPIEEVKGHCRKKELVRARHGAMFFFKRHTNLSVVSIGQYFNGHDHAAVLHAVKQVKSDMKIYKSYWREIRLLSGLLWNTAPVRKYVKKQREPFVIRGSNELHKQDFTPFIRPERIYQSAPFTGYVEHSMRTA